ncbi:hypothetical protein CJU89_5123 [Yarrowia sp. B02]|nr:hypothetical protein CJU89_5123 [Yarrowia sp. B02]
MYHDRPPLTIHIPPTFTSLVALQKTRNGALVNVVARVEVIRHNFIGLSDFSSRQTAGQEDEVVVYFDYRADEWTRPKDIQIGHVIVLTNFVKKTGNIKGNPLLYTKRHTSKVQFYNLNMQAFAQYPSQAPPPEYNSRHTVYSYISKLVDDWKADPRAGLGGEALNQSFPMSLQDTYWRFDKNRITTLKGRLSQHSHDLFELTDAPGWTVQLEAFRHEDELGQRCRDHDVCVEISYVRFKTRGEKNRMTAKMTDRSEIHTLSGLEKNELKRKLDGEDEEESRKLIAESTQNQSPGTPGSDELDEDQLGDLVDSIVRSQTSSLPSTPNSHEKRNRPSPNGQRELKIREPEVHPTVRHEIPARKKIKSESPMTRTPTKPQVSVEEPLFEEEENENVFNSEEKPLDLSTQLNEASQLKHSTQLTVQPQPSFPSIGMAPYSVPEVEEPYLVVKGVVEDSGLSDEDLLSFCVYCESVDKRFLVKIRPQDESAFFGNLATRKEARVRVLHSLESQEVKVNLLPDEELDERGQQQYWSLENSLELVI